ncbi:hypothetical protein ACFWBX_38285 [Streptomyces sp. NPDC059991]|uniref:hypothetical protein n=1 Tax=Streptomyces sp. NPDC059991 TaxID=3347028 RepID=UPI0036785101
MGEQLDYLVLVAVGLLAVGFSLLVEVADLGRTAAGYGIAALCIAAAFYQQGPCDSLSSQLENVLISSARRN